MGGRTSVGRTTHALINSTATPTATTGKNIMAAANAVPVSPFIVPSKEEYKNGLTKIWPHISPKQKKMLQHHFTVSNRTTTATHLAEAADWTESTPANRWYGELAKMLGAAIDLRFDTYRWRDKTAGKTYDLAYYSSAIYFAVYNSGEPGTNHWLLAMHHNLADAIRELRLFPQDEEVSEAGSLVRIPNPETREEVYEPEDAESAAAADAAATDQARKIGWTEEMISKFIQPQTSCTGYPVDDEQQERTLEKEFEADLRRILDNAKKDFGWDSPRFAQMLNEHGGVKTAHLLLMPDRQLPRNTFGHLRKIKREDLTMEFYVIQEKYRSLFTDSEVEIAQWRLVHES
jgi:hypothetical protein